MLSFMKVPRERFGRGALRFVAAFLSLFLIAGASQSLAGTLNNRAHATGSAPGGAAVNSLPDEIQLDITPKDPEYTVNKTVVAGTTSNGTNAATVDAVNDTLTYTIAIANTGNVTLDLISITDPGPTFGGTAAGGTYTIPATPTSGDDGDGEFEKGETWTYQITYVLTQDDVDNVVAGGGAVNNSVAVVANDQQGIAAPLDAANSDLTASITLSPASDMTVDKQAVVSTDGGASFAAMLPGQTLNENDIVRYSYVVTNTGNTTLENISIVEDLFNGTGGVGAITIPGTIATLAPTGTGTLTADDYTVTQADIDNLQ